jgi:hypothetical protein
VLAVALYIYDPLMLFHKPYNRDITLHSDMRAQASGIIHSLEYDSFILGTSMLENTSANNASNVIGGKYANISISDGDLFERSYPLKYALKKDARSIVYSLDSLYIEQRKGLKNNPFDSYSYLYTDNLNKLKFYLQPKYILCLSIWSNNAKCVGKKVSADRPNYWMKHQKYSSRFGGLENWFKANNNDQIKAAFSSISETAIRIKNSEYVLLGEAELNLKISNAIKYIDDYLISYVRAYPATQFHFIFPPYSRITYAQWHQLNVTNAKVHEAVIRYFAKMATELNNLSVYGYEDQDFLDDIANYKDPSHYGQWVNDLMLKDIAEHTSLLTTRNVDLYIEKAKSKALAFDLIGLGTKIDTYLNKSIDN